MQLSRLTARISKQLLIATITAASVFGCCNVSSAESYYDEYYEAYLESYDETWDVYDFYYGDPESAALYAELMLAYSIVVDDIPTNTDWSDYYEAYMVAFEDTFGDGAIHEGDMTMEEATNIFMGLDYYYTSGGY